MLKSEGLVRLVELESNDQLSALPSAAKRGIAKALVLAGGACEDQASSQSYHVGGLIQNRSLATLS